jgi:hypothetical protein
MPCVLIFYKLKRGEWGGNEYTEPKVEGEEGEARTVPNSGRGLAQYHDQMQMGVRTHARQHWLISETTDPVVLTPPGWVKNLTVPSQDWICWF